MATEQEQDLSTKIQLVPDDSTSNNSPVKIDKLVIKEKKKKTQALRNFLNQKKSQQIIAPTRKKSASDNQEVVIEATELCRVCNKQVMKKKFCGFCNFVACNQHMRKKRKHPKSGKFVKVCDECQDKHLFEKYMKLQLKSEQALQLQQMIIATKHQQLCEVLNGKRTKMTLLLNKKGQINEERRVSDVRLGQSQNQVRNKERKLESKFIELDKLGKEILDLQKSLPRSLQEDHQVLISQNEKINKQLVKYEKMCNQALKAKSQKQKQMYEQYYKWQLRQTQKTNKKAEKKQDCTMY